MADLGPTIADSLKLRNPAAEPDEAMRKQEVEQALAQKADAGHTHQDLHEPATVDPANKSVALAIDPEQKISAEVKLAPDSGMEITDEGLRNKFGAGENEVARGNHTHANDHVPATADPAQTETIDVTVSLDQKIKADAKLAANGGLKSIPGASGGIAADVGTGPNQVAAGNHSHPDATPQISGLMSGADKQKLDSLQAVDPLVKSIEDTKTINLDVDANGKLKANVKLGSGLREGTDSVEVDPEQVADKNHIHSAATQQADGFMSASDKQKLDGLPSNIPGELQVDPTNKSVAASINNNTLSAEVRLAPDSGLEIADDGLKARFGTGTNDVARGDHTHPNDHVPAAADLAQTDTATVTVSPDQKIKADVKLAPNGGLKSISGQNGGVAADVGPGPNQVAAGNHGHATATSQADGFMSKEDKAKLDDMDGQHPVESVVDTKTVDLQLDAQTRQLKANVKAGAGLKEGDDDNLEVDFDQVSSKNHSHPTVTDDDPGFATPEMKQAIDDAVATVENLEAAVLQAQQDISTLANEKADAVTVEEALEGKSDVGHTHPIAEVTGLQAVLDGKAPMSHIGSTSTDPAIGHPAVTEDDAGFMTPDDKQDLTCLRTLLREVEFAHALIPMIRVESPNLSGGGAGQVTSCPLRIEARNIAVGGDATKTYTVDLQLRGAFEIKKYTGGTVINNGRVRKDSSSNQVVPENDPVNVWKLILSDDGSGQEAVYFINGIKPTDPPFGQALSIMVVLNETLRITIRGGSTITVSTDTFDNLQLPNTLIVPDVPPYPQVFPGHFIQIDAVKIIGECSLDDIMNPGNQGGILIIGRDPRDGRDGQDGSDGTGTPGVDGRDGATVINEPIWGVPPLDLVRDLARFSLMDGGEANGNVYDILVDDNGDIWLAGSFTRYGNRESWGLARLDKNGRYHFAFKFANKGFSEPIRHIRKSHDGKMYVASVYDGMLNEVNPSLPIFKINLDGTRDPTFNPPPQIATDDNDHPDIVIGLTVLQNGKVVVLTPKTITVLNTDGTVYCKNDADNNQLNWILANGNQVLLSSHAFADDINTNQRFRGKGEPRGLKLLDLGDANAGFSINPDWAAPDNAGTGAMSSCCRSLRSPNGQYFIVGNALAKFNSRNTSWNAELLGNLFGWSNAFGESSWIATGALELEEMTPGSNPPDSEVPLPDDVDTAGENGFWRLSDNDNAQHAYLSQNVGLLDPTKSERVVVSIYVKKTVNPTTFPVFQIDLQNGDTEIQFYTYFNTQTGVVENHSVFGGGNPVVTIDDVDANWWRLNIAISNNGSSTVAGNDVLIFTIFPAYSNAMGGSSTALTGSLDACAAQMRFEAWESKYVHTDDQGPVYPSNFQSNSDRFRGLYKIGIDGNEDPDFHCNIAMTNQNGHVVPFAIDKKERIYVGGPISSIDGTAVPEWKLYRLTKDGVLDKVYDKFDNDVLVCRINDCGKLVVGGKFTAYGSHRCGRVITIDPDSAIPEKLYGDGPIIFSETPPDVEVYPCLKKKLWADLSVDPLSLKVWSESVGDWVEQVIGGFPILSPVNIDEVPDLGDTTALDPAAFPILNVTLTHAINGVQIWYTTNGKDPKLVESNAQLYAGPFNLAAPCIVQAYATKNGYTDSITSSKQYGQRLLNPNIQPLSGNVQFPVQVTISMPVGSPANVTLKYTTDGTDPLTSGTVQTATAPVTFNLGQSGDTNKTVRAYARKTGYLDSGEQQANYGDIQLLDVLFDPPSGAATPLNLTMKLPDEIAQPYEILYTKTMDGSMPPDPRTDPNRISGAGPLTVSVDVPTKFRAYATKIGFTPSIPVLSVYGVQLNIPTFSPQDGNPVQQVTITSPEDGTIHYQLRQIGQGDFGQEQTGQSPLIIDLANQPSTIIRAWVSKAGWNDSDKVEAYYYSPVTRWLLDVNFSPNFNKVGRAAIFADPFRDFWNVAGTDLRLHNSPLKYNRYDPQWSATQAANEQGGAIGFYLSAAVNPITQSSVRSFEELILAGDDAYKMAMRLDATLDFTPSYTSVAFGDGIFVAVTPAGEIFTSDDGQSWTRRLLGQPGLFRVRFLADDRFYAVGASGTILRSVDGIEWVTLLSGAPTTFYDIAFGETANVQWLNAVGSGGRIYVSNDEGANWSNRIATNGSYSITTDFYSVEFGNGMFVAVGAQGVNAKSTDGFNWLANKSRLSRSLYTIRFGNGYFIAAGAKYGSEATSAVFRSATGTGWVKYLLPLNFNKTLRDMVFTNGYFLAVGDSGKVVKSTDNGLTWALKNTGVTTNLLGVAVHYEGWLYAVGQGDSIASGTDGDTWDEYGATAPTSNTALLYAAFTNLDKGFYDVLIYGHGINAADKAKFNLRAENRDYGTLETTTNPNFDSTNWQAGRQYVLFQGVELFTSNRIDFTSLATALGAARYVLKTIVWTEYSTDGVNHDSGGDPESQSTSVVTNDPGVSVGDEIEGMANVGDWSTNPNADNLYERTATRVYYNSSYSVNSGWINAIQLRKTTQGARLGRPRIQPEDEDNLPILLANGGVGLFCSAGDESAGLAGAIKLYYKIETGDRRPDVADPLNPINPPTTLDTLYTGPFELTNHASGKTVKVIAVLPGRTSSFVTAFWYRPQAA